MALAWAAVPCARGEEPASIDFNFDQVDIPAFARLVGDLTGLRFVVAGDVKDKITVVSPRVKRDEVYPLFVRIIETAGCSIVRDGDLYRVVRLPARQAILAPVVGPGEVAPSEGVITKVIRLEHVPVESLRQALEARMGGRSSALSAIEETNHLIVTDTAESVRQIEKMVAEIDRPGLSRGTEVVVLQYAAAEELARQLNAALVESESRAEMLKRRLPAAQPEREGASRAYVVPASDSNRLILVGAASQIAFLKSIIVQMDVDVPSGRGRLNAVFLKYISAEEAAKNINALLESSAAKEAGGAAQGRRIAIEAGVSNNALLVDASPGDFRVVLDLVNQMDVPREQVHIEVLIAEVSSGDALTLGVEMAALDSPAQVGGTVVQGSSQFGQGADSILNSVQQGLIPRGLTFGLAHGRSLDAAGNVVVSHPGILNIDAVRKDSRFRIVSKTALEAQNNQEASLSIVDEIPILTSTIQGGAGTSRDVIQNIDRIEVGVKLTLTPHVIPGGLVRMDLNPKIEAFIEPQTGGDLTLTPTIARREVSTTVTVPDRSTIVIAGLTRHDQTRVERRVPVLGSLPLLGWLFRHTVDSDESTDLLILVTPRIVGDAAAMDELRRQWQTRTGLDGDEFE